MAGLEPVMARLANFPIHGAALAYLVRSISSLRPRALGVKGSLASGNFDRYSDIDFYVVVDDAEARDALREPIFDAATKFGRPIASFAATHLNDPYMLVAFCESGGAVVKLDVNIVLLDEYPFTRDFLVIAGSQEEVALRIAERTPIRIDLPDVYGKMTGWMWYAYTKIARGELFEAAAALDFMRALALLPSLQFLRDVPAEGYRRLERRLPAQDRSALAGTYTHGTTAAELLRALLSMQEFFDVIHRDIVAKTGIDHRRSDMPAMRSAIEADARLMKLGEI
jgi:predicted nucleotidyltransferase